MRAPRRPSRDARGERVGEIGRQRFRRVHRRSERFDLKADVDGRRRMRQRADRHEVGAGRRELGHALERDAAGDLDLRAAARAARRPRGCRRSTCCRRRIDVGAGRERLVDLRRASRASTSIGRSGPMRARTRATAAVDAAGQPDVVVLDQHRVEQARRGDSSPPPARDGVLLQRPQRRRRLARVEDGDAAAGGVDEPARRASRCRTGAAGS